MELALAEKASLGELVGRIPAWVARGALVPEKAAKKLKKQADVNERVTGKG